MTSKKNEIPVFFADLRLDNEGLLELIQEVSEKAEELDECYRRAAAAGRGGNSDTAFPGYTEWDSHAEKLYSILESWSLEVGKRESLKEKLFLRVEYAILADDGRWHQVELLVDHPSGVLWKYSFTEGDRLRLTPHAERALSGVSAVHCLYIRHREDGQAVIDAAREAEGKEVA